MSYRNHLASVVMAFLDDGDDARHPEQNSPNQFELFSGYPTVVTFNTAEFLLENSQIIDFRIQGAPENEDGISQNELQHEEEISQNELQNGEEISQNELQNGEEISQIESQNGEEISQNELQNGDEISQNELQNGEQISQSDYVLFQDTIEQQDDKIQHEIVQVNPDPEIETVEIIDTNSQEIESSNIIQVEPMIQAEPVTQAEPIAQAAPTTNQITQPRHQNVWRRRNNRRRHPSTEEPSETLTSMSVQGLDCPYVIMNDDGVYQCMKCDENQITKTFKHKYSFQRHAFLYHEGARKVFPCPHCHQEFSRPDKTIKHMKTEHDQIENINKAVLFKPANYNVEMFKMN